jgi:hypothetical protein
VAARRHAWYQVNDPEILRRKVVGEGRQLHGVRACAISRMKLKVSEAHRAQEY